MDGAAEEGDLPYLHLCRHVSQWDILLADKEWYGRSTTAQVVLKEAPLKSTGIIKIKHYLRGRASSSS